MNEFKPGEIVDITIKGARVHDGSEQWLAFGLDDFNVSIPMGAPRVTVERVAPAEWPPRPRDVWGTDDGGRWFAARYIADPDTPGDDEGCNSEGWRIVLVPTDVGPYGDGREGSPDEVREQVGRMFLVHREDEQDGGRM